MASDGALWVGTRGAGVARCRPGPGGALADCRSFSRTDGLGGVVVRALAEDRHGRILVGTRDAGLSVWEKGRFRTLRAADGLPGDDLYALLVRRTGEVVVGTDDGGLAICLDLERPRCRTVSEANGLPDNGVRALAEDREGSLWIGTEGGLARLGDETVLSYGESEGLPDRQVYALAADGERDLWVGTFRGLARLTLAVHGEPTVRVWTRESGGLPGRWVWALHIDRAGRVWVGTDGGLCRMTGERCQPVVLGAGLPADYVLAIAEDPAGELWIGGTTGVSRLRVAADGTLAARRYTRADGLRANHAYGLAIDGAGRVWVAHTEGLSWFDGERFHVVGAGSGLPEDNVRGLGVARDGALLAGGYGHVSRALPGPDPPHFQSWGEVAGLGGVLVLTAAELDSGRLLLGTSRGVLVLDTAADGGRGAIVARFDRALGAIASEVSHSEAFAHRGDGRYWFGFKGGLTGFPPRLLARAVEPPVVAVVSLDSERGRAFRAPFTAVATGPIGWLGGAPPQLPPDDRGLRVRVRATSLRANADLRYQFRLEGVDADWSEPRPEPFRDYTSLDPGSYRLRVRAAHAEGTWGEPAELDFVVRAAWWQAPAVRVVAGLLALAVAALAVRWRVGRIQARTRELEREVAGRTDDLARYARALAEHLRAVDRSAEWSRRADEARRDLFARTSHELRTPLTAILGFSELLERALGARLDGKESRYLANVRDGSEHLLRLVNNLLDQLKLEAGRMEVHEEEIDLGGMLASIVSLMEGFALHRGVRLDVEHETTLGNVRADVAKLRQILLNLLSNAVKFSPRGERVTLAARILDGAQSPLHERSFELTVRDRGPGIPEAERESIFEPYRQLASGGAPPAGTGLGLPIARQLVELMGGVIGLDSAPGHGSAFSVVLPVDPQPSGVISLRGRAGGAPGGRPRLLIVEPERQRFSGLALSLEREQLLAVRAATVEEAERMLGELRPLALSVRFEPAAPADWERVQAVAALSARAGVPLSLLAADEEGRGFALSLDAVLAAGDLEAAARAAVELAGGTLGGRRPGLLVAASREPGAAFAAAVRRAGETPSGWRAPAKCGRASPRGHPTCSCSTPTTWCTWRRSSAAGARPRAWPTAGPRLCSTAPRPSLRPSPGSRRSCATRGARRGGRWPARRRRCSSARRPAGRLRRTEPRPALPGPPPASALGQDHDAAEGLVAARGRGQAEAIDELVLEPAHEARLRRQFHGVAAVERRARRGLGLAQRYLLVVEGVLDREVRAQEGFDLAAGAVAQDVERPAFGLGRAQGAGQPLLLRLESHHAVGVGEPVDHHGRHAQVTDRALEPRRRQRVGQDPQALAHPPAARRLGRRPRPGDDSATGRRVRDLDLTAGAAHAHLGARRQAAQGAIDDLGDVAVDGEAVLLLDLDRTSKVGGALRSSTVFWVPRRRASSSESVTAWMPPTRSARVGFASRFSSALPWAVAISWTPRSAIVRAASASAWVPISSMTTTSGMWFSTASIMIACCSAGEGTCMRRARPMPGCGMSPSPAISLEVSTTITRLPRSSASTRAASRNSVVLPTPGRPSRSVERPVSMTSRTMSTVPTTARPTRQVRPTIWPRRLRSAEMRCRVRSMPARLSGPKAPTRPAIWASVSRSSGSPPRSARWRAKRASGGRPRSRTISSSSAAGPAAATRAASPAGSTASSCARSSSGRVGAGVSMVAADRAAVSAVIVAQPPPRPGGDCVSSAACGGRSRFRGCSSCWRGRPRRPPTRPCSIAGTSTASWARSPGCSCRAAARAR